jgi:hypothetical protein
MSAARVRWTVLRLYPAWWRERYADEVEQCSGDLVEAGRASWRISLGLFWGAVRTRVSARGMPNTPELWAARARACLMVAAAPVFVVVPFFAAIRQVQHGAAAPAGWPARVSSDAYLVMLLGFVVLLFTSLWGYGSLCAGLEGGAGRNRVSTFMTRAPGRLVLIAIVLFVASVVVGPHASALTTGHQPVPRHGSPDLSGAFRSAALVALLAGWAMVLPVLTAAVRRGAFSPWLWRSGRRVSSIITAVLWVMAVAATTERISDARLAAVHAAGMTFTVLGSSVRLLVAVLGGAALVSSCGTSALSRSLRMGRSLTTTV